MTELQGWILAVGNLGLGTVLVIYLIVFDRPRQQLREDKRSTDHDAAIERIVASQQKGCAEESQKDREHTLELARLQGEVHKTVVGEIKIGLDSVGRKAEDNGERIERLEETQRQLFSVVQKIVSNGK